MNTDGSAAQYPLRAMVFDVRIPARIPTFVSNLGPRAIAVSARMARRSFFFGVLDFDILLSKGFSPWVVVSSEQVPRGWSWPRRTPATGGTRDGSDVHVLRDRT